MANSLSASFPEYWSRRMQRKHNVVDVYRAVANFEEQKTLKNGDKVHRPYRSALTVNTLGSEGSYTRQDITDTDESLTIDKEKEVSFYVRDIDAMQSNYRTINEYADDAAVKMGNWIDGDVFGEYANAVSSVDDGDLGGTASNGITLTTSNIIKVFGEADEKLNAQNVDQNNRWALISPQFKNTLWQYIAGKESLLGDKTGMNGNIGEYNGFKLYMSNNLAWSGRLEFGTNPSDGDTVVINGVTITFQTALTTASGSTEVHICASAGATLDSLVAFINAPGTSVAEDTNTGISSATSAEQALLKGITATDGATYMTLKAEGRSYVAVSETLTAAGDIWTTTKQVQHCLFGQGRPIDVVIQKYPNMVTKDRDGYIGKDIVTWSVYGIKTFAEGARQLVDVQLRSDAY